MNKKNNQNVKQKSKGIKNPTDTIGGKILIWILIGIMVLIPTISFIYLIATSF